jgi:hypothetical protein
MTPFEIEVSKVMQSIDFPLPDIEIFQRMCKELEKKWTKEKFNWRRWIEALRADCDFYIQRFCKKGVWLWFQHGHQEYHLPNFLKELTDDILSLQFNIKRSESHISKAREETVPMLLFPVGEFIYLWNENIWDMSVVLKYHAPGSILWKRCFNVPGLDAKKQSTFLGNVRGQSFFGKQILALNEWFAKGYRLNEIPFDGCTAEVLIPGLEHYRLVGV